MTYTLSCTVVMYIHVLYNYCIYIHKRCIYTLYCSDVVMYFTFVIVHEEVYTLYCMMYYCNDKALPCYNNIIIVSIVVQYIVSQLNNSAIFETVPDGATTLHFAACKMLAQCSVQQYCVYSTHGSIHCTCYIL